MDWSGKITRRTVAAAGISAVISTFSTHSTARVQRTVSGKCAAGQPGCDRTDRVPRITRSALPTVTLDELAELEGAQMRPSIGDASLEKRLASFGWEIERRLGYRNYNPPALIYFEDDPKRPGATYWHVRLRHSNLALSDGVICLGRRYIGQLVKAASNSDAAIFGIMAHEMAHASQYKGNYREFLDSYSTTHNALAELHADYLAGWFWGQSPIWSNFLLDRDFISATANAGDNNFNCPRHHGTPEQRIQALRLGYSHRNGGINRARSVESVLTIVNS